MTSLASVPMLAVWLAAAPAATPGAGPAAALRSADAIIADYIKAVGGAKTLQRKKSLRMKREVEAKGMNIQGTEERWATAAGKLLVVTNLAAIGTVRMGSDGRVLWSEDPIHGLRVLQGAEEEQARIDATWNAELQLTKLYRSVKPVEPPRAAPPGQSYECLELVPHLGKPVITCFDVATHLRVYQQGVQSTPTGEVPYSAIFLEWRPVDGVHVPFVEEMTVGPLTLHGRVVEVVFDERLSPRMFKMPAAPGGATKSKKD